MKQMDDIILHGETYQIIACENECIFHPAAFDIEVTDDDKNRAYSFLYEVDDFQINLKAFETDILFDATKLDQIPCQMEENKHHGNEYHFLFTGFHLDYTGSVLIAKDYVRNYFIDNKPENTCFSYQNVKELVFNNGVLVTTIDHKKAMLRIRKNLELGLRKIYIGRDFKCIERFIRHTLVGDYHPFHFNRSRMKYYNEMKENFETYLDQVIAENQNILTEMEHPTDFTSKGIIE